MSIMRSAADLAALHEALDAGAAAALAAETGDAEGAALVLQQAATAAGLAFPPGSTEAGGLSAVLSAIRPAGGSGGGAGEEARELPDLSGPALGDWVEQGLCCRSGDPGLWFRPGKEDEAKAICGGCPVRAACLEYALAAEEHYGVWGAMDPVERQLLRDAGRKLECASCSRYAPVSEFSPNGLGGYLGKCRPCRAGAAQGNRRKRKAQFTDAAASAAPPPVGGERKEGEDP